MKKKSVKSLISIMCVILMMLSAGCSSTPSVSEDGEVPTLVWYVPGDNQDDLPLVLEKANEIIEPAIGAKLDLQFIAQSSYTERIKMLMAAQTEFDLMLTGYVNPFNSAYQNGGLMDITKYVNNDKELKNILPDYAWDAASFDNKIYAVPNQQIWGTCYSLAIRKDIAEKYNYNIDELKNEKNNEEFWKKVVDYWELVKKNETNIIPLYMSIGSDVMHMDDYESIAGNAMLNYNTNKLENADYSPISKKHGEYKKEWYDKGYIRKDIATVQNEVADYKAGRYATALFVYKPGVESEKKIESGYEWVCVPFSTPTISRGSITATMTALSNTCKHPEKALELVKLMNTNKELYRLICHGIEGVHYEKLSDNVIRYKTDSGYLVNSDWKFGNQFNAYVTEGKEENIWDETKKINDSSRVSPAIGFAFDSDSTLTVSAQLSSVSAKYPYFKGIVDVDSIWDTRCKELKDAGSDDLFNEVQRQYNEYLKNTK